jgi:vancomycin resistance protein YoaR
MRRGIWESGRGWLTLIVVGGTAGAVLALGTGMLPQGLTRAPGQRLSQAAGTDGKPNSTPQPGLAPAGPPDGQAPVSEAPAPVPNPRIVRALNTRVALQAGKVTVRTELRRLGADLAWPDGGEPEWSIDERRFERGLRRLARRAERRPRDARLMHAGGAFKAMPGRGGQRLDQAVARRHLLALLTASEFRAQLDEDPSSKPSSLTLTVPLRDVPPAVTPAQLGRINAPLASYSTGLGSSSRNRRHNIQIACEAIDGTVLLPGQVFSYNATVGPRSERAGYRTAPVIIRGELVPGTGGGICQVSSTLYNAALLADMKIVRRSHHQFPVSYVAPGRDATVAYGSLDLRFANSLPGPVALDVKMVGWRVIVRVYGTPECRRQVRLVSSRIGWTRPRVPAGGGRPRPGKRVTISRVVQLPNGSVRKEVVSRDVYAPAPASAHTTRSGRRRGYRRSSSRHARVRGPHGGRAAIRNAAATNEAPKQSMLRDESPL